jgi:antitoxin MazE
MKVAKWGNSLAVRVPAADVARLGLKEGDDVEANFRKHCPQEMVAARRAKLDSLDHLRGLMPADYKFDREEANARG